MSHFCPLFNVCTYVCHIVTSVTPFCLLQSKDSSVFVVMYLIHRTVKYFVPAWTAIVFIHPNKLIERGAGYVPIDDRSDSLNWAQNKVSAVRVCVSLSFLLYPSPSYFPPPPLSFLPPSYILLLFSSLLHYLPLYLPSPFLSFLPPPPSLTELQEYLLQNYC